MLKVGEILAIIIGVGLLCFIAGAVFCILKPYKLSYFLFYGPSINSVNNIQKKESQDKFSKTIGQFWMCSGLLLVFLGMTLSLQYKVISAALIIGLLFVKYYSKRNVNKLMKDLTAIENREIIL